MKFAETKEEQIQYVENDISRLENEYCRYKKRKKYSIIGALLLCICAIILTIMQFKIFDADSGFNAFLIICLILGAIVLIVVVISSSINQSLCEENIATRKSTLALMKDNYEKYVEKQNQELSRAIKEIPNIISSDDIHSPKCPICGSYDLSQITPMKKARKIFMWGVYAASEMSKTWKCNNCGSKF